LYTGVGFDILSFRAGGYSEGKDQKYDKDNSDPTKKNLGAKSSAWDISGINVRSTTLSSGTNLGFGLTYEPSKNLVIGFGITEILGKLISFDVTTMQLKTASFSTPGDGSESAWFANNILASLTFDLTISAKF